MDLNRMNNEVEKLEKALKNMNYRTITIKDEFSKIHQLAVNLILHYDVELNHDVMGLFDGDTDDVLDNVINYAAQITSSGYIHLLDDDGDLYVVNQPDYLIDSAPPYTNWDTETIFPFTKGRFYNVSSFMKNKLPKLGLSKSEDYPSWINISCP